jgi:hypothetical protein
MIKKVAGVCILCMIISSLNSYGYISWFNTSTNRIYYNNSSTPLVGSRTDPAIGCFLQLIWVGANGTNDLASNAGSGVTIDDQIVAVSWIGKGAAATNYQGYAASTTNMYVESGSYFVRVWSAPSPSFVSTNPSLAQVPSSLTNFYGDSFILNYTKPSPEMAVNLNFGVDANYGGWSVTLSPIPEPAVFGLGIIGLISLRLFARKRK